MTEYSLYAAMSVGLQTSDIIEVLDRLSKCRLPTKLLDSIRSWTSSYGKIKLVLKHNRYYLESKWADLLQTLLRDEIIKAARATNVEVADPLDGEAGGMGRDAGPRRAGLVIPGTEAAKLARRVANGIGPSRQEQEAEEARLAAEKEKEEAADASIRREVDDEFFKGVELGLEKDDGLDEDEDVHTIEIKPTEIEVRPGQLSHWPLDMLSNSLLRSAVICRPSRSDARTSTTPSSRSTTSGTTS